MEVAIVDVHYTGQGDVFEASVLDDTGVFFVELSSFRVTQQPNNTHLQVRFLLAQVKEFKSLMLQHGRIVRETFLGTYEDQVGPGGPGPSSVPNDTTSPYDMARKNLDDRHSQFITGEGGSGKSYLAWQLYMAAKNNDRVVVMTAMTGLAAQELRAKVTDEMIEQMGGHEPQVTTLHSFLNLPMMNRAEPYDKVLEDTNNKITKSVVATKHWQETQVLMVDEVSMLSAELLQLLFDLQTMRQVSFQFVFLGDFAQLPPVGETARYCFESDAWRQIVRNRVVVLDQNFRVQDDVAWRQLLCRMRLGKSDDDDRAALQHMSSVYRPITANHLHIYPMRQEVSTENARRNAMLKATGALECTYNILVHRVLLHSATIGTQDITLTYNNYELARALVQRMKKECQEECDRPELQLFVGSRVLLDTNDHKAGLTNGMRGTVLELAPDRVTVNFDGVGVKAITMREKEDSCSGMKHGTLPVDRFVCKLRRIPLRLAFAITVHKAQGTTLDYVYMNFVRQDPKTQKDECTVFSRGQVYVALSRARRSENMVVDGIDAVWSVMIKPLDKVLGFYAQEYGTKPTNAAKDVSWRQKAWLVGRPPVFIVMQRWKRLQQLKTEEHASEIQRKRKAMEVQHARRMQHIGQVMQHQVDAASD